MTYTNSSLATYKKLSPNHSGTRTRSIDRITPHCVVGQLSAETLGNFFTQTSRQVSCNYIIDKDGKVGLIVEEKNRSWCTSSSANDQRALTVEIASDTTHPYTMNDVAYRKLIDLCEDICKRYNKTKLVWISDKTEALKYEPKANEMQLTVHRWFANKACPGDWLFSRLGTVATEVTKRLNLKEVKPAQNTTVKQSATSTSKTKEKKATGIAKSFKKDLAGKYKTTATSLNIRNGAGTTAGILGKLPKGTTVECFGYYTAIKSVNWLYVQCTVNNVKYTGFVSSKYLTKGTTVSTTTTSKYFKQYTGNSGSIVDSLKAIGVDSSFSYRTKIAKANGIKLYASTAAQNIKLLTLLKQGKLVKP